MYSYLTDYKDSILHLRANMNNYYFIVAAGNNHSNEQHFNKK